MFALSKRAHTFELNLLGNDNRSKFYTFPCRVLGLSSKGSFLRNDNKPNMFVIRSYIGSTQKCGAILKLKKSSHLSSQSFGLGLRPYH